MVARAQESMRERLNRCGLGADPSLNDAMAAFFEPLGLSDLDLMTIRDLVGYGPDPHDPCLIALLGLMFAARAEGSLCLRLDADALDEILPPLPGGTAEAWVSGFMRRLVAGRYDTLVGRAGDGAYHPLILDDTAGRRLLYFQKYHFHEERLRGRLERLCARTPPDPQPAAAVDGLIDALYSPQAVIRDRAGGRPMTRDPSQIDAIRQALYAPLLVITGGPGTGKTSLLVNILRALMRTGTDPSRIVLAAPTGRAAQRMSEALAVSLATIAEPDDRDRSLAGVAAATLHKWLAYRRRAGGFTFHGENPLAVDVIAVDEVSMVDVVMMDHLFQAVDLDRTRVILIGDKDQLPSVDAGAVLADLNPVHDSDLKPHFVELSTVFRSTGRLRGLARDINRGRDITLEPVNFQFAAQIDPDNWAFVEARDAASRQRDVDQWIRRHLDSPVQGGAETYVDGVHRFERQARDGGYRDHALLDTLFRVVNRCRVLTVVRRGPTGMTAVNDRIAGSLRRRLDPVGDPVNRHFNGAWIMITSNDYARGLFNGDVGLVLLDPWEGAYYAYFQRGEAVVAHIVRSLPDWELAFAMTVHKSQGSQFENVLLLLPDHPSHRLLTREVLYTAATRASQRFIVYGAQPAFHSALKRKMRRQTGLLAVRKKNT